MTSTPATTSEMEDLDQLGAKAFDGFLVRKYPRQYPVPTYMVEFLLGRHCASTDPAEIEAGLQIVNKQRPARHSQRFLHGQGAQPGDQGRPDRRRTGARQRAHAHRWLLSRGVPGVRPGTRDFLIRSIESRSSISPCRLPSARAPRWGSKMSMPAPRTSWALAL